MSNPAICASCKQSFSSRRYLKCHLRWNKKCDRKIFKLQDAEEEEEKQEAEENVDPNVRPNKNARKTTTEIGEEPSLMDVSRNFHVNNTYESDSDVQFSMFDDTQEEPEPTQKNDCNTQILEEFLAYTRQGTKDHRELSEEIAAGIELLSILTKSGAPLGLYDIIYTWHVKHYKVGVIYKLEKLLPRLRKRYNMERN